MDKTRLFFGLLFFGTISVLLLQSCENVINVNLQDSAPRLVVEGSISNLSDSVKITLHRSTDYFKPAGIIPVTNASVSLADSKGDAYLLINGMNGVYSTTDFHLASDDMYTLHITADGSDYSASTKVPYLVKIDSLDVLERTDREHENQVVIYIKDPAGIANYYQVKIYRNDSLLNNGNHFALYSDKYFDGKSTTIKINARRFGIPRFLVHDTLKVQLINLDKMMYDYFQVLRDITEGETFLSASTPSNPPNNISHGALGYFAAWSVSEKRVIVK